MTPKIIDVRTYRNGDVVDALSANKADGQTLSAILLLSDPGDEITIIVKAVNPVSHE